MAQAADALPEPNVAWRRQHWEIVGRFCFEILWKCVAWPP